MAKRARHGGGERADARQGCAAESPFSALRETVATVDGRTLQGGIGSLTSCAGSGGNTEDTT